MTPVRSARSAIAALLVVLLPAGLFSTTALAASAEYSEAEIGQIGEQAIHILGGNANVISRWVVPVQYALVADAPDEHFEKDVVKVFAEIQSLTDLSIHHNKAQSIQSYLQQIKNTAPHQLVRCTDGEPCINFPVVISDIAAMRNIAREIPLRPVYQEALQHNDAICFFAPYQRASAIFQALVFVNNTSDAALIRTCLNEEIYQAFGLFNDYTGSDWFSFNNRVQEKQITSIDKALLQTVYEFSPGAPAFAVAQKLIKSLQ